jgi:hypothetical protein
MLKSQRPGISQLVPLLRMAMWKHVLILSPLLGLSVFGYFSDRLVPVARYGFPGLFILGMLVIILKYYLEKRKIKNCLQYESTIGRVELKSKIFLPGQVGTTVAVIETDDGPQEFSLSSVNAFRIQTMEAWIYKDSSKSPRLLVSKDGRFYALIG